jgi:hypothetical protein
MDEVDGMSAGDRGGMAELIQLLKRTKVHLIIWRMAFNFLDSNHLHL